MNLPAWPSRAAALVALACAGVLVRYGQWSGAGLLLLHVTINAVPWKSVRRAPYRIRQWWRRHFGDYARIERAALPDGTTVRLHCKCNGDHEGVWITSWTPRRSADLDGVDDYLLTRVSDGEQTFAVRKSLEVVAPAPPVAADLRYGWPLFRGRS